MSCTCRWGADGGEGEDLAHGDRGTSAGRSRGGVRTSEAPIVEAPRWLQNLLAPPRPLVLRTLGPQRCGRGDRGAALVRTVAAAEEGNRNNMLWWAARKAHEDHGGDAQLLAELRQAAIAGGQTATAVDATIRSAERWVQAGGRR